MANFWGKFKKPAVSAVKTIGEWFKELPGEVAEEIRRGVGKTVFDIQEARKPIEMMPREPEGLPEVPTAKPSTLGEMLKPFAKPFRPIVEIFKPKEEFRIAKPGSKLEEIFKTQKRAKEEIKEKVGKPMAEWLTRKAPREFAIPAVKGFLGEPLYEKVIEPVVPERMKKPEGKIAPAVGKITGWMSAFGTVAKGYGMLLNATKMGQTFVRHAPRLAQAVQTAGAGLTLAQIHAPLESTREERKKIFTSGLPQWIGWGVAGGIAPKKVYAWLPTVFGSQYASSKLEGKSKEDALKDSLTMTAIFSLFKVTELPKSPQRMLKEQAAEKLGVKPTATLDEIKRARTEIHRKYSPLSSEAQRAGTVNEARVKMAQEGYNILTKNSEQVQHDIFTEIKDYYNYLRSPEGRGVALTILRETPIPMGLTIKDISKRPTRPVVTDKTGKIYNFLEKWTYTKRAPELTPDLIESLKKYRPLKPVKLYRAEDFISKEIKTLTSWTHEKGLAEEIIWAHPERYKIISRVVNPNEILVDFSKLPKEIREDFIESEVIVFRPVKAGLSIRPVPMKPVTEAVELEAGEVAKPTAEIAKRIVKYSLPAQYEPKMGKATWKHGQMLWRTMRNSYGETNKFAIDVTKNKGAVTWVIDRLSGGNKKLAPLMNQYEGQRMSYKQYKKLYAMFKSRDYDLDGYRHVMANLKGIEPVVTKIVAPTPAKTMGEMMAKAVPKAPAKLKTADELLKADKIRPKVTGLGKGRFWEYRDEKGTFTVAPNKEEAVKRANEALKVKLAEAPKTMAEVLKPETPAVIKAEKGIIPQELQPFVQEDIRNIQKIIAIQKSNKGLWRMSESQRNAWNKYKEYVNKGYLELNAKTGVLEPTILYNQAVKGVKEVKPEVRYSPERLKLHQKIINKLKDRKIIDADEIKELLPEYDFLHPELVHAESRHIRTKLIRTKIKSLEGKIDKSVVFNIGVPGAGKTTVLRSASKYYDIIYETTGNHFEAHKRLLEGLRNKGFKVDVNLVAIPQEQSLKNQAWRRSHKERAISDEIIKNIYPKTYENFFRLKEIADSWKIYDHQTYGKPIKVAQMINGDLTIFDKSLYNEISNAYGQIKPRTTYHPLRPREGRGIIGRLRESNRRREGRITEIKKEAILKSPTLVKEAVFSLKKHPKGKCFQNAIDYMMDHPEDKSLRLVHAKVTGQGAITGIRYDHAWVEKGNLIIDTSRQNQEIPKLIYYPIGNIKELEVRRYTADEMRKKMIETENYGPWEEVKPEITPTPETAELIKRKDALEKLRYANLGDEKIVRAIEKLNKQIAEAGKPKTMAEMLKPKELPEFTPTKLEERFRKPGEIIVPAKITLKPAEKTIALQEASKEINFYTKVEGGYGILNQGKVEPMNRLAKEIADLGYKPQIVPHPTIKDTYTIRPYKLGYGCDGSTDGNLQYLTKDMLTKRGLTYEEVYKIAYPGDPLPFGGNLEKFAKETIVPETWGDAEVTQLAKDLREINNYKLADAIEALPKEPTMQSIKEIIAERSIGKPPKPPKPPTPTRISPAPEEPEGLSKITQRRKEAIEKLEITPEEFAPALEAQKRGKIPFPEIIKKSEALKADIDKIAEIKPGTIKNAEQVEAFRQRVNGFKKEVDKLKQNYIAKPTPISKQAFDTARAKLNKAIVNVEAIRSEMARGLSASRIDAELDRFGDIARRINEVREKLNPEKQLIFDKRLEHLDIEDTSEVMRFLTQFTDATLTQKVLEYYRAALLSAPITHIRNTAGNTMFLTFDVPVRALAGGLDAVKSIAGKPRTVYATEALKIIYGGTKAIPDAVTEAMKALRDEFYQYGTRRMTLEAGMKLPAIKGLKGRIIRLPYRALSAMDLFSRTIKTAAEIDALAYRLAKQEGKKGIELVERIAEIKANPPADMVEMIGKRADRALFLEELNGVLKTLESAKNKHPIVQFITPFYRTPVNLVREAYRLTPARLVTAKDDVWLRNQSTRMEEIARMILGSLIGGTIIWRTLDGSIEMTGPAPTKSAERDLFYRQGKQPYSARIGNNWYSYREVHPFSTIAFLAHQIGESIQLYRDRGEITEKEIENQANRLITETSKYLQDLTFFQGISNFLEAISGGTYNQGVLSVGTNYVSQLLGGFIPNILYSYQRAADPTIYSTKGFAQEIQKRIPGMQESLLPKRSVFGIPAERTGGFLIQFLSPIKVSKEKRDVVDDELAKLDVAIGYPQRSAFGEPLTDYEYDAYLQDSGHRIYERLWSVFQDPDYQASPNADKISNIEKIASDAREESRVALFKSKEQLSYLKKKYEAEGLSEVEAQKRAEEEISQLTIGEIFRKIKTPETGKAMSLEDLRALIAK